MTIFSMLSVIVAVFGHAAHSSSADLIRPRLDLAAKSMTVVNNNTECRSWFDLHKGANLMMARYTNYFYFHGNTNTDCRKRLLDRKPDKTKIFWSIAKTFSKSNVIFMLKLDTFSDYPYVHKMWNFN